MTAPGPDLSPASLRRFYQARVAARASTLLLDGYGRLGLRVPPGKLPTPAHLRKAGGQVSATVRRDAGISKQDLDRALAGHGSTALMARVWAALGVEP